ncbi:hypothetical protein [Paraburkholderia sp. JPY419]
MSTFRQLFKRKTGLSPSEYRMRSSRGLKNILADPDSKSG